MERYSISRKGISILDRIDINKKIKKDFNFISSIQIDDMEIFFSYQIKLNKNGNDIKEYIPIYIQISSLI